MSTGHQAPPWTLNADALERLLLQLDADRDRAGAKYERLRQKLITFFECRGSAAAEDCADITIDRVARRLADGELIQAANPVCYFLGVARNVAREQYAHDDRERRALDQFKRSSGPVMSHDPLEPASSALIECARRCLQSFTAEDRTLILAYYQGDKHAKIVSRQRLAARLQVAPSVLRLRAYRIRVRLEACMRTCSEARNGIETNRPQASHESRS